MGGEVSPVAAATDLITYFAGVTPPLEGGVRRRSELDALSTLGTDGVDLLLRDHETVSDWPAPDQLELKRLALLREDSVAATHQRYPQLWSDRTPPPMPDMRSLTRNVPAYLLPQVVDYYPGDLPVLLTVPHDGYLRQLGAHVLPQVVSKGADIATRAIALGMYDGLRERQQPCPTVVVDAIDRLARSDETKAYFEGRVFQAIGAMLLTGTVEPLVHLDIHGYWPRGSAPDYDLILGTAHGKTDPYNIARRFAEFMIELGYSVYVPGMEPVKGERYAAESPATLVGRVHSLGFPVSSIQVEINSRFRIGDPEAIARSKQLAYDLGAFCLSVI